MTRAFEATRKAGRCDFCDNSGPTLDVGRDERVSKEVLYLEMCEFCYRMGCGPIPGDRQLREEFSRLARTVVEIMQGGWP